MRLGIAALISLLLAFAARAEVSDMVCFPPWAPFFGEKLVDEPRRHRTPVRALPPAELADFVNESFYPALSSRLLDGTLSRKLRERVDAYYAARARLLHELADHLTSLHGAAGTMRETELRAFAADQSPRIVTLEHEAEQLRRALIDGGVLKRSADWSRSRRWRIGQTIFKSELAEKEAHFQVVRAAAFYQDGLNTAQRGLLLELAAELRERARAASPIPLRRRDDAAAMFFSPATSRLRLPSRMPPALVAKIGRYNREKTALKDELREAVLAHDGAAAPEQSQAFDALADRQWPRLAALEELAEEIRVEMTALPPAPLAAPPHIPPGLMARIKEYQRDREVFLDEFNQALEAAAAMVPPPRIDPKMTPDDRVQLARQLARERAALRAKVAEAFQRETHERFMEMRQRYDTIQEDLKLVAAGQFDPETGRPFNVETLLQSHASALEKFETFGREEVIYRGYRTAMLMPGLSPEQRRLLFGAALIGLSQSLPFPEAIPTGIHPVPRS